MLTFILWIEGCVTPSDKNVFSKEELLFNSDSLLSLYPDDTSLLESILYEKIAYANRKNDVTIYQEILKIDPKNPTANYHILMDDGFKKHKKDMY